MSDTHHCYCRPEAGHPRSSCSLSLAQGGGDATLRVGGTKTACHTVRRFHQACILSRRIWGRPCPETRRCPSRSGHPLEWKLDLHRHSCFPVDSLVLAVFAALLPVQMVELLGPREPCTGLPGAPCVADLQLERAKTGFSHTVPPARWRRALRCLLLLHLQRLLQQMPSLSSEGPAALGGERRNMG